MGLFFYRIFLGLFNAGVFIAAFFNSKAKKWVNGRKGIWERLQNEINPLTGKVPSKNGGRSDIIWMHCASLGEFEQGRPLLEKLRTEYPGYRLLLTFFSPSGYEVRKRYQGVDWVFYLPLDGARNAKQFLQVVDPALVIFVKYEFWYFYLAAVRQKNVPLLLVSALFREDSVFFKWYGRLQRKILSFFDQLFVQNEQSRSLLMSIGINNVSVTGDTRFDRVIEIASLVKPIAPVEKFIADRKVIVAGSTWPPDEELLQKAMVHHPDLALIIAPHEVNKEHLEKLAGLFPGALFYSQIVDGTVPVQPGKARVLIIDNIGMLSSLYQYAFIAYVGGGFGKGIHNTLEAAVYGKPVLFGPAFQKFQEAKDLVSCGGAFVITGENVCIAVIKNLKDDEQVYIKACNCCRDYVLSNRGATQAILNYIQENRLLTR